MMRRITCFALLLVSLAACTPREQDYRDLSDPPAQPIGDHFLKAADGTELPLRHWLPKGKPQAVIIALHGFNDYSNAFAGTGKFFSAHAIAVYAYDQRGFGTSPHTGIWAGEYNLLSDVRQCVRQVAARYPGVPIYLLGESMGGAVAVVAADKDFPPVKGVILSAPAVWGSETMNPFFRATLWLAAHTVPGEKLTGAQLKILASNNLTMLRLMAADPLVLKKTRVDAIYGMVQLMDDAHDQIPTVTVPALLLYGGKDQVIPRQAIEAAVGRFESPLTVAYYPHAYHLLLRDLEGEHAMKDILSWIKHPERPLPSGASGLPAVPEN